MIPVIGRHSRPEWEKWPGTREDTLLIYPDRDDIDVRLLGVADKLRTQIGDFPGNWQTYSFNELDPAQFLRTIDFFVYYHHKDWVEGFGRNIAEALASGCVVILPPHFQPTFKEAAIYCEPGDVVSTILEFYTDRERYRIQSQVGRRFITRLCGPDGHIERIRRLIDAAPAQPASIAGLSGAPTAATPDNGHKTAIQETDVALIGDFRRYGETAWRVAHEARIQAEAGYRTALIHLPGSSLDAGPVIHPAIDACVTEGLATPLDPAASLIHTRLLIIHGPENVLVGEHQPVPHILADKVVVVGEEHHTASTVDTDSSNQQLKNQTNEDVITNYELNKTVENYVGDTGTIDKLSVAVLVNGKYDVSKNSKGEDVRTFKPRSDQELVQIKALVRSAVGYNPNRGDVITVSSIEFNKRDNTDDLNYFKEIDKRELWADLINKGLWGTGLLVAFFLMRMLLRSTGKALAGVSQQLPAGGMPFNRLGSGAAVYNKPEEEEISEDLFMKKLSPEARAQIKAKDKMTQEVLGVAKEQPEDAARLIRTWLTQINLPNQSQN